MADDVGDGLDEGGGGGGGKGTQQTPPPKLGALRDRVQIQEATQTPDAYGDTPITWSTVATRWASVLPLVRRGGAGGEQVHGEQIVSQVTTRVQLRFVPWLTTKHRFLFRGTPLEILGLACPDGRKRFLLAMCVEKV